MAMTLPPDYYLDNFCHLMDFVAQRYWPLLSAEEQRFHQRFSAAPRNSRMLYIRLLSRRGEYFLVRKLHYPEIGQIRDAAAGLARQQLLRLAAEVPLQPLVQLLTRDEIRSRIGQPALKQMSRRQMLDQLFAQSDADDDLARQLSSGESIYQLLDQSLFDTFKLCFFGNMRQDLTSYVLRDLGLQQYETYPLHPGQLLFRDRGQIERHLHYYHCRQQLQQIDMGDAEAIWDLWQALPAPDPEDSLLTRRRERLANELGRQLERLRQPQRALQIYGSVRRPPARERSARIHIKAGAIATGLALCRQMADAPVNEDERQFAQEFGYRQGKKHGIAWPSPPPMRAPSEALCLSRGELPVEAAVAQHLAANGPCYHVENSLLNGVLGLAIWDIIFAPLAGVFFNPFQHAPMDFYQPEFRQRRQQLLRQRLDEIREQAVFTARVLRTWHSKQGLANPLVNWQRLCLDVLQLALERIPVGDWMLLLQRLLEDLQHHRSGMPDLIVFPHTGGYQWVEVKGPGDKLQKNQKRWLAFFADHDMPHRVIYVDWLAP